MTRINNVVFLFLAVMCFTTIPIFAGGGAESAVPTQTDRTSISFWAPAPDQATEDYYNSAVTEFNRIQDRVTVNYTPLPAPPPEIDTRLNAAELMGEFPDVFASYIVFLGTRGIRGDFLDLSDYIAAWDDRDDIFDGAIELGRYGEKHLGVAFSPSPNVFTYRRDFFEEVGLDPDQPPTSWEELAEYSVRLAKRDTRGNVTRAGFDIPAVSVRSFVLPFVRQNRGSIIGPSGEPFLDNPRNVEALEFLGTLAAQNVSIPFNFDQRTEWPFVKGNSAMAILVIPQIRSMVASDPTMKDKLGFGPPISRTVPSAFAGNRLFTIGSGTQHPDESWEFIQFMMSVDQMRRRVDLLNIPPTRRSLADAFINAADSDFDRRLNRSIFETGGVGLGFPVAEWSSVGLKHLENAYEEVYHARKSAAEALRDAQREVIREIGQ